MRRWLFPPLEDGVRGLVRQAAAVDAAPSGAKARVQARVEAIVSPSGGDGGAGPAGEPGDSHRTSVDPSAPAVRPTLALAVTFAVGGAAGAFVTYGVMRARIAEQAPRVVSVDRPEPVADLSASSVELATSAARERPALPAPTSSTAASPARSTGTRDGLADERALLDAARGAIEGEDGTAALAATAKHERKYPHGVLVQEREAIAVRALVLLGRKAEARARVDRFRANFPDSLLLPTIESVVSVEPAP